MPLFTATVRVAIEGYITIEADDEEAAFEACEALDYVQVMAEIDIESEEVEVLGELEEVPAEDAVK